MTIQQRGAATLCILSDDGVNSMDAEHVIGTKEWISNPFHPYYLRNHPNFLNDFNHNEHWYSSYPNTTPNQLVVKVKKAESNKDNFVTVACIGSKFEKKFPKNLVSIWEYGQPEPNPNGETGTLSVVGPYAAKELPNCPLIGVAAFLPRWHDAPAFDLSDKWGGGGSMKHTDFGLWGEQQYGDGFPVYNGGALWVECVNLKTLVRKINAPNSYPADEMVEEPMQCVKSEIKYTPKWRIQYDTASCWSHGCRLKLVVYIEKVSLETYPIDQNGSWEYPTYGYTGIFCKPSGSSEYSETKEFEITFNEGSFLNPVEFEIEPEKGYLKYVGDFYITDVYH